jgi:hypothetical protein
MRMSFLQYSIIPCPHDSLNKETYAIHSVKWKGELYNIKADFSESERLTDH